MTGRRAEVGAAGRCLAAATGGGVDQRSAPAAGRAGIGRRLAQIGMPGQSVDVLAGGDVDGATGRLLTVAELQVALRLALAGAAAAATPRRPALERDEPTADEVHEPDGADDPAGSGDAACSRVPAAAVDAPSPAAEGLREWGGSPVPVAGSADRPVIVHRAAASAAAVGVGWPRFPVADLLRLRPKERGREAGRLLASPWPGPRRVLVASLTGGAGRSTTAALLWTAAADAGVPVMLLDAAGDVASGLAARVPSVAATRRGWTQVTDRAAAVDFAALRRRSGTDGQAVSLVSIDGDRGSPPPPGSVGAAASAAAGSWPLVIADVQHGQAATRAVVNTGGFELLVMLCRPDPGDIEDTTGFLRDLTAAVDADIDVPQRAVVAVRAGPRGIARQVRRALVTVTDVAAGVVIVPHVPELVGRRATAGGPAAVAAGRLLAAAAALTPAATGALPVRR